ncbi:MFS transporter [Bacillus salipaludis]|uniref:MFS transporter n=1 Tax=Bacillus salipaludis TaxID=2547811 RepID=A0AA90R5Z5_9BACI|nr:MFS transporter [Bacillus salipaludis]MDQ6596448.1 MFS transporter [Bacillus salipaludis]
MKNESFRFLTIGQSLADGGDVFYIIALITIVYGDTKSAFYVSLVPLTKMVSGSLSGALAPFIIDKYRLKSILSYSQLSKTLILLLLAIYCWFYLSTTTLILIFVLVFLISFLDGFSSPSSSALLPSLVPSNELAKANSVLSSINQFIQLGGWAIGGVLASLLGTNGLFFLTFILYILSTMMMFLIKDTGQKQRSQHTENKIASFTEGWKIIIQNKSFRTIHLFLLLNVSANTVWVSALLYPFMIQQLKVDTGWWGYINTALLLGLSLAGVYVYRRPQELDMSTGMIIIKGSFMVFLTTALFGINKIPLLALLLIGVNGFFQEITNISIHTLIQSMIQGRLLAKVYAAQTTLIMITFGVSTMMMGLIADSFNIVAVYCIASFFLCLSFLLLLKQKKYLSAYYFQNSK